MNDRTAGVIGVAIGALVRNQIAAVVGVLVWMLAIEQIVIPAYPAIGRWMPGGATYALFQLGPSIRLDEKLLSASMGGLLLIGTRPRRSPSRSSSHQGGTSCNFTPTDCARLNPCLLSALLTRRKDAPSSRQMRTFRWPRRHTGVVLDDEEHRERPIP